MLQSANFWIDLRMPHATPLLVLTQQDILSELRHLYDNMKASEDHERAVIKDVTGELLQRFVDPSFKQSAAIH